MAGYYLFAPVLGYRYENVPGHGKMLVPNGARADLVREVFESTAAGRFASISEIKRFLEQRSDIPRDKHGEIRWQYVIELMRRPLYAGLITVEKWNIHDHPGRHEPLVSLETFTTRFSGCLMAVLWPRRAGISTQIFLCAAS